jgi:hypothetical protein
MGLIFMCTGLLNKITTYLPVTLPPGNAVAISVVIANPFHLT